MVRIPHKRGTITLYAVSKCVCFTWYRIRIIVQLMGRMIMTLLSAFSLLGGVGLFLYGMTVMSDGLKDAAGDNLQ